LIVEHGREMKDIGNVVYHPRPKSVSEMLMKGRKEKNRKSIKGGIS
jgi:hypothetical protein